MGGKKERGRERQEKEARIMAEVTEPEGVTAAEPKEVSHFFVLYYAIDLRKASPKLQSQCAELYGADAGEQTGNKKGDLQTCYDAFVDKYYKQQEVDGKVRKSYEEGYARGQGHEAAAAAKRSDAEADKGEKQKE